MLFLLEVFEFLAIRFHFRVRDGRLLDKLRSGGISQAQVRFERSKRRGEEITVEDLVAHRAGIPHRVTEALVHAKVEVRAKLHLALVPGASLRAVGRTSGGVRVELCDGTRYLVPSDLASLLWIDREVEPEEDA